MRIGFAVGAALLLTQCVTPIENQLPMQNTGIVATAQPTVAKPHDPSLSGRSPVLPTVRPTPFPFNSQVIPGDLSFINDHDGWLSLNDPSGNYLLHTEDAGGTWIRIPAPGFGHIAFADRQRGWLLATSLFVTDDGGGSWRIAVEGGLRGSAKPGIADLTVVDATHAWILSAPPDCDIPLCTSTVLGTTDGVTWHALSDLPTHAGITFVDARRGWAALWTRRVENWSSKSNEAAILVTDDGGLTWRRQFHASGAAPSLDLAFADRLHGWALGSDLAYCSMGGCGGYTLYRTTDGGDHWDVVQAAEKGWWGPTPDGASAAGFVGAPRFTDATTGWLSAGTGAGPGGGGVLVTHDGGLHWSRYNGDRGTFLSVGAVAAASGRRAWAVMHISSSTGREDAVMVTDDGGTTWQRQLSWSWSAP